MKISLLHCRLRFLAPICQPQLGSIDFLRIIIAPKGLDEQWKFSARNAEASDGSKKVEFSRHLLPRKPHL